jgi:hypothetical protein
LFPNTSGGFKGFDDKTLPVYAPGLTARQIREHLKDIYAVEVSPELISRVTDEVKELAAERRGRQLEPLYPVLFPGVLRVNMRDGAIRKAVYTANAIESVNYTIQKIIKHRQSFPVKSRLARHAERQPPGVTAGQLWIFTPMAYGLNARLRRKFTPTANSNHGLAARENLLNREFQAKRGGGERVSDIPRTTSGWVYLTVALDLYDRKAIGWDNACAESFFKTLKRELETLDGKHAAGEVRQSVFMYIEAYYGWIRPHSVLDYVVPLTYLTVGKLLNSVYQTG